MLVTAAPDFTYSFMDIKLVSLIALFLYMGFSAAWANDALEEMDYLEAEQFINQPPVFRYEPFVEFTPCDHGPFRADISITLYIPRDRRYFVLEDFSTSSWDWWAKLAWFHPYQRMAPPTNDLSKFPQIELPPIPEIADNQDWRWHLPWHPGFKHPRLYWHTMLDVR